MLYLQLTEVQIQQRRDHVTRTGPTGSATASVIPKAVMDLRPALALLLAAAAALSASAQYRKSMIRTLRHHETKPRQMGPLREACCLRWRTQHIPCRAAGGRIGSSIAFQFITTTVSDSAALHAKVTLHLSPQQCAHSPVQSCIV
jgi:hypothetical protein